MSDAPKAITRYDPDWDKDMVEAQGGDWVRFEDHNDVVQELQRQLASAKATLQQIDCECTDLDREELGDLARLCLLDMRGDL